MLLASDFLKRWEDIVDQVDKNHVPINCVKKVIFRTTDRKQKTINLKRLRDQGVAVDAIEQVVENYIKTNNESIMSMEFLLDVEAVAELLQPETDKLLKGI